MVINRDSLKTLATALKLGGGLVIALLLFVISRNNYLFFHTLIEGFSIVVAVLIFILATRTFKYSGNGLLLFLGNSFLFIAVIDFFHTATYKGIDIFPVYGSNTATQLWLAGRYLLALTFLLAALIAGRRISARLQVAAYAAATALLLISIMWLHLFPVSYIEGLGLTAFKVTSEYVISLAILVAMLLFYRQRGHLDQELYRVMMVAMACTILSEMSFTLYVDVYGVMNFIGHIFKAFSYWFIFEGVVLRGLNTPYETIFQDLNTSAARYRTIFETTGTATVIIEEDTVISLANNEFEKLSGYKKEEIEGKISWLKFISPEYLEQAESYHYARRLEPGMAPRHYAAKFVTRNGETRDILITVEMIPGTKERVASYLDITERKQAEEVLERHRQHLEHLVNVRTADLLRLNANLQMEIGERKRSEERIMRLNVDLERRAQELIEANKELESFSYSVSHDLRAPLRSINGFSQMIFNKYKDQLDEESRGYLQIVRSECNRMGELIDDLLDLSRLSRKELTSKEVDLSGMVEAIAAELHAGEPGRRADFIIKPGIRVNGDSVLLQSVIENLMKNAWKFTGKHAHARIEFGDADHEGKRAYFIRDDGAGFDMQYSNKLFGAFQRLHGMDEFPGNGIGLAIVQRIIHRHGGQVWAEAEVEKGATFYFTLL